LLDFTSTILPFFFWPVLLCLSPFVLSATLRKLIFAFTASFLYFNDICSFFLGGFKVLRLARLLRLLDFVSFIPEIRVLSFGLVAAMESVW